MKARLFIAGLLAGGAACAGAPQDYGYRWSLALTPGEAAHRIELDASVYAHLSGHDLRDIEVFDAAGQAMPFGPLQHGEPDPAVSLSESTQALPWYALPPRRAGDTGPEPLSLLLERDAQGRLRRIEALAGQTQVQQRAQGWVFDASAATRSIETLTLSWPDPAPPGFTLRARLSASADLEHWRTVLPDAHLVDLRQGALRLSRRNLELPQAMREPYFMLELLDAPAPLLLDGVQATTRTRTTTALPRTEVPATFLGAAADQPQQFDYRAPGPLPVERVTIELADDNSVSEVGVYSRARDTDPWQWHGNTVAFRLGADGDLLRNDALGFTPARHRQWRLQANPPLAHPPRLRLGYRPEQFVLLADGGAQAYTLHAGSATARRADYPVAVVLGSIAARSAPGWQPPLARLAAMETTTRGAAALQPPPPPKPVKTWLLWSVLLAGVLSIGFMVLRLIRSPPPPPAG